MKKINLMEATVALNSFYQAHIGYMGENVLNVLEEIENESYSLDIEHLKNGWLSRLWYESWDDGVWTAITLTAKQKNLKKSLMKNCIRIFILKIQNV